MDRPASSTKGPMSAYLRRARGIRGVVATGTAEASSMKLLRIAKSMRSCDPELPSPSVGSLRAADRFLVGERQVLRSGGARRLACRLRRARLVVVRVVSRHILVDWKADADRNRLRVLLAGAVHVEGHRAPDARGRHRART